MYVKINCNYGEESVIENYDIGTNKDNIEKNTKTVLKDLRHDNKNVTYTLVEVCN